MLSIINHRQTRRDEMSQEDLDTEMMVDFGPDIDLLDGKCQYKVIQFTMFSSRGLSVGFLWNCLLFLFEFSYSRTKNSLG